MKPREDELKNQKLGKGRNYYQGMFVPINKNKYLGDVNGIVFRSRWELLVFKFCDLDTNVVRWNSEDVIVQYICKTDGKSHRYFVDLYIEFKSGAKALVEIKPMRDALPAKTGKGRKESTVIMEQLTYLKNMSKWEAAKKFAEDRNMVFMVWTENTLRSMGIKI